MKWFPDWSGETCIIVAGGPSAKEADLSVARGKARAIAINNSWRLAPWADILYGCDFAWWREYKGVPGFAGVKVSQDLRAHHKTEWNIKLIRLDGSRSDIIRKPVGRVGAGGHGGFHCINLAMQFGATRLLLVGFDMRLDKGIHWFGKHPPGLNNPSAVVVEKWRVALDGIAPFFAKAGVEVLNCSQVSALTAYPKVEFAEAL